MWIFLAREKVEGKLNQDVVTILIDIDRKIFKN